MIIQLQKAVSDEDKKVTEEKDESDVNPDTEERKKDENLQDNKTSQEEE